MILYVLLAVLAGGLLLVAHQVLKGAEEAELLELRRKDAAAQRERINRRTAEWQQTRATGERIERGTNGQEPRAKAPGLEVTPALATRGRQRKS